MHPLRRFIAPLAVTLSAFISAAALANGPTIRVNVGGPAYTDSNGALWSADTGYNTGSVSTFGSIPIQGTSDPELYRTERSDAAAAPELEYSFVVPNATYLVRLHFAENSIAWPGERMFHVDIEGTRRFSNIDVSSVAGKHNVYVKTAAVTVTDGQLNIGFVHGSIGNPFVNAIEIIASGGDTQPPTAPTNLTAWVISPSKISIFWNHASDDLNVEEYLIERCQGIGCTNFAQIGTSEFTYYDDMGLPDSTSYTYRVRARDDVPHFGGYSNTVSATTRAPPDTQAPSAPASLTTTIVSATQINLSWAPSTDNVGVTAYLIERCEGEECEDFAPLFEETWAHCANEDEWCAFSGTRTVRYGGGTTWLVQQHTDGVECSNVVFTVPFFGPPKTCEVSSLVPPGSGSALTYSDKGLTSGVTYRYRIRAQDGAFNLGAYSAIVSTKLIFTDFCD